jgi:thimet oligopeptidase
MLPLEFPTSRRGWFDFLAARCDDQLSRAQLIVERLTRESGGGANAGDSGGREDMAGALADWNTITLCLLNATSAATVVSLAHPDAVVRERARAAELAAATLGNRVRQDQRLYAELAAVDADILDAAAARTLRLTLRDFRRAGVDLDEPQRRELQERVERCTELAQQFEQNISDDVRTVRLRPDQLDGLPEDYLAAHPAGQDGTVEITTAYPDVFPFLTFAHDLEARRSLMTAFLARAWPANDAVLRELLELRARRAHLLGYKGWADYDAEVKMVGSGPAIAEFLDGLATAVAPVVRVELAEIEARLRQDHPDKRLTEGDLDHYTEVLRRERFEVDKAEIRRYLGFGTVVAGLLEVNAELFDLELRRVPDAPAWHPDVATYDVLRHGELIGRFHLDLHPRDGKYTHAAHFALVRGLAGVQLPQSVLLCNVSRGLLTLGDVVTLFHEFGHLLNSILSGDLQWARDSGVATERDFVEAPAFMFEEWPRNPAVLRRFAVDRDGNRIPVELVNRMGNADRLGRATLIARQVAASEMAYRLHEDRPTDLTASGEASLARHLPVQPLSGTHDHAAFTHLADERYGSGYYAYLWSYVIAKDLFSAFDPDDLQSPGTAHRFRDRVLAAGGSRDGYDLIEDFLGRPLSTEAFHLWLAGTSDPHVQ